MQSLPVAFGIDKAKWICVASIDVRHLELNRSPAGSPLLSFHVHHFISAESPLSWCIDCVVWNRNIDPHAARAARLCRTEFHTASMRWQVTQLAVAAYLYAIGETTFAAILFGLVLPQM